jgi:hypothetical protein
VRLIQDKGYSIYTIDIFDFKNNLPDIIIFLGLDWLVMYYAYKNNVPSIYIAAESPIIEINHQASELVKLTNFFSLIFTWDGSLIGHQSGKFRNFYYSFRKNRGLILQDKKLLLNRELLCHVSSNIKSKSKLDLYQYRSDINKFMSLYLGDRFHFYGRDWEINSNNNKGYIEDKFATISRYKFTLVIENCSTKDGYVSEKILDVLQARSVPVYLGAENISQLIDKKSFIDIRLFNDFKEVADYLIGINDDEYITYLNNADKFLNSKKAIKFTKSYFLETLNSSIIETVSREFYVILRRTEICRLYSLAFITKLKRIIKCVLSKLGVNRFGCYNQ